MKRIITIIIALGLIVPAVAVASRVTTDGTRTAIERAAGLNYGSPNYYLRFPQRCLIVRVTTKDGGNWATVGFNGVQYRSCGRWGFNGVDIVHRVQGRWHYVASGSARIPCGRLGIPLAVQQDLRLPCRPAPTSGTPASRHLRSFLSPDRHVWCVIANSPSYAYCGTGYGALFPGQPQRSAMLRPTGTVRLCFVAAPTLSHVCVQNWDSHAPGLAYGQQSKLYGFLCTSKTSGITCTVLAGAGKGKGFRVNKQQAVKVG